MIEAINVLIVCLSLIVCVLIITRTIKTIVLSRTHLSVFNKKALALESNFIKKSNELMIELEKTNEEVNSKLDVLTMRVGSIYE